MLLLENQTTRGLFGTITKDKITLGIFAVTVLAIAGAVLDSDYSIGLGNGSMHLFPAKNNPFKLN